jgi:hypothetical protein
VSFDKCTAIGNDGAVDDIGVGELAGEVGDAVVIEDGVAEVEELAGEPGDFAGGEEDAADPRELGGIMHVELVGADVLSCLF